LAVLAAVIGSSWTPIPETTHMFSQVGG
jgi:hypothetical protein